MNEAYSSGQAPLLLVFDWPSPYQAGFIRILISLLVSSECIGDYLSRDGEEVVVNRGSGTANRCRSSML